jgi:60 kDa SS-A/Ro ribonucleoprotein
MTFNLTKLWNRKNTPQSEPMPGTSQVPNSAGGFGWAVDDWVRLDRFLVLGVEGGSYYSSERALTRENAKAVERCIAADGARVVRRIVEISDAGRAPKNDPAIFALAMAAKLGDLATRRAALAALPKVCRIGTHLMHFAESVEAFGGWGRGTRTAVGNWYNGKSPSKLAYQLVKYQSRDGWSNRDLLRLAHPKAASPAHDALYKWAVKGELALPAPDGLAVVEAFEAIKKAKDVAEVVRLVRTFDLPREAVPTEWLSDARVWEALLERMPVTAMIRNLATMTRAGLLAPLGDATAQVTARLADRELLKAARLHPITVLAALLTYRAGHGARGQNTWSPVGAIVDALDAAFYATFMNVEPTGKRTLLALDVSGSMESGVVAGVPGLTPRLASAALALITAVSEPKHAFVAFSTTLTELDISPRWRLDRVVQAMSGLPFAATDCAQPMLWATERKLDVDTFVVYTDSETWAGGVHPAQALEGYRRARNIAAKSVVVGMVSNGFSIADPNDAGMLDVVGFDTATPAVIADFARA